MKDGYTVTEMYVPVLQCISWKCVSSVHRLFCLVRMPMHMHYVTLIYILILVLRHYQLLLQTISFPSDNIILEDQ